MNWKHSVVIRFGCCLREYITSEDNQLRIKIKISLCTCKNYKIYAASIITNGYGLAKSKIYTGNRSCTIVSRHEFYTADNSPYGKYQKKIAYRPGVIENHITTQKEKDEFIKFNDETFNNKYKNDGIIIAVLISTM